MEVNESPLYLMVDPFVKPSSKDLPVYVYESELHVINDIPKTIFVRVPFKIETLEAERIAVDHVARIAPVGEGPGAQLISHLSGMHNAIKMLSVRLRIIHQFLDATRKGAVPRDHRVLRMISSLCNRLPAIDSANFHSEFLSEYNDGLLVTYLASITKSTSAMNDLVGVARVLDEKQSRRRGIF
eukprot:tig00021168_g19077.t1